MLFILSGASSCGKRKPPLPPVERVAQRVNIDGVQRGNEIRVVWQMPPRNAPDGSTLNISRADIYRLAEPLAASLTLSEDEFASRSTLIGSVPIADSDFALKQKTYTDVLRFAGQPVRLRYAVRFVNASGQRAAFSNFLIIEPTAGVAERPRGPELTVSQEAVTIEWQAPEENVDGSTPANISGYNVYRIDAKGATKRLNDDPIPDTEFQDEFFTFGEKYEYFVRTVSLGGNAEQLESLDSTQKSVTPVDTFAPDAPTSLTVAAAPNNISIFFAANIEKDIAGYSVYRSTDPLLAKDKWDLLTAKPIDVTTFQDKTVRSGTTYYYYVKAIDKDGNISGTSEVVSDTAL
jgi:fibronectin type 3 domain-containing protein